MKNRTIEYYKWAKHNPIKFVERCGISLKWYQKIMLFLSIRLKRKRKLSEFEKAMKEVNKILR